MTVLQVNWRTVGWGLCLQLVFAFLILRTSFGYTAFEWLGDRITEFLDYTLAGVLFVFGENYYEHYFAFAVSNLFENVKEITTHCYH